MNILALVYPQPFISGADLSTLEFIELLKNNKQLSVDLNVVMCSHSSNELKEALNRFGIKTRYVPCYTKFGFQYRFMELIGVEDWIKWADIVWINDAILVISNVGNIKKIKNIPIIVHLRSYPYICFWWTLFYGMKNVCYEGCSPLRITKCKQSINEELSRIGILGSFRAKLYEVLDFVKGPVDYLRWSSFINDFIYQVDGFIAVSDFVKKVHKDLLQLDGKPIETIYNPVTYPLKHADASSLGDSGEEEALIVYASGSNPVKGPHLALQALRILVNEGIDAKLVMFRCKDTWVEGWVHKLKLRERVITLGREPLKNVYRIMSRAKVVIMPSIWPEPFGRVSVEANRLGVPSVITSRGGLPETIVPGVTGYVAEPEPGDLAMKVLMGMKMKKGAFIKEASLSAINPSNSLNSLLKFFSKFT